MKVKNIINIKKIMYSFIFLLWIYYIIVLLSYFSLFYSQSQIIEYGAIMFIGIMCVVFGGFIIFIIKTSSHEERSFQILLFILFTVIFYFLFLM